MEAGKADRIAGKIGEGFAKVQPIPRTGITDDIAQCVIWLASDRSSFVNGIDVVVDGGMIGGRMYSQHQEGIKQMKTALGI
jgi:NAD(P)-dependent dehydrogenase (short-subunit alcohol dehydrogenase family)